MNKELLLELIYVATIASIISSQVIQKIKQTLNLCKICNKIASIVISLGIGFCYAISFYSSNLLYAGWILLGKILLVIMKIRKTISLSYLIMKFTPSLTLDTVIS